MSDEVEYEVPEASSEIEVALEQMQGRVARGRLADDKRKELIKQMHHEEGRSQREIAERLSRASVAAGGPPVTENQVFKILSRLRKNGEDE